MSNYKLEHKSCFDFLKTVDDDSVDLVCIDPPYAISRKTGFKVENPKSKMEKKYAISYEFGEWDNSFTGLDVVLQECYRVLKKSGTIICFYDLFKIQDLNEWLCNAGFNQIRFIEWLKTNPVPINSKLNYLTNTREIALTGVKGGNPIFNSEYDNGVYNFSICQDKDRFHPTQKPIALITELIKKHSNEGDLVLDCFSGSGTTAIASLNTQRNFIGCELDENYYIKSQERIQKYIKKTKKLF